MAFETQIFNADFKKNFRGQAPAPPAGGSNPSRTLPQAIPHQKILDPPLLASNFPTYSRKGWSWTIRPKTIRKHVPAFFQQLVMQNST